MKTGREKTWSPSADTSTAFVSKADKAAGDKSLRSFGKWRSSFLIHIDSQFQFPFLRGKKSFTAVNNLSQAV